MDIIDNIDDNIVSNFTIGYNNGYYKGSCETWKFVFKLIENICSEENYSTCSIQKFFEVESISEIFKKYSALEAMDKFKEYEKNNLKIGDEVYVDNPDHTLVVARIYDNIIYAISQAGAGHRFSKDEVNRTGRNFSQIAYILDQLKG